MADPYLGEIQTFAFDFAPRNWAACEGQLLPIAQNQALFALLGTTFGGDGITTFALPDLRGRIPMHVGPGYSLGQVGGEIAHALTVAEMPAHGHVPAAAGAATAAVPTGAVWANSGKPAYGSGTTTAMNAASVSTSGGSQPHLNMAPSLTITFAIALTGIFPSVN